MNDSQDTDVIDATRASGHDISEASRASIRANLQAAVNGEQVAPVIGLHTASGGRHRSNRRRVLVTGLVAAAASIAAVAVVANRDDSRTITPATVDTDDVAVTVEPSPNDPSPTEPTPTEPTPTVDTAVPDTTPSDPVAFVPANLDQLIGETWYVVDRSTAQATEPWPAPILPWISFGASPIISGFDGCNTFTLTGSLDDGALTVTGGEGTTIGCDNVPVISITNSRLTLSADQTMLALDQLGPVGREQLTFVAADRLTSPAAIDGPVIFDDTVSLDIDFLGNQGTLVLGTCGFPFAYAGGNLTIQSELSQEQLVASCIPGLTLDPAEQRFYDAITSLEPLRVVNDPVSGQLILIWNGSALRMSILGRDVGNAIVPEWVSVAGVRTGQEITAEATLAQVESVLGPVDHDTGWYTTPVVTYDDGTEDCLGGKDYRVLWWGDFSVALWRIEGVESIWAWSVGDVRSSNWGDRRESYTPTDPVPTALATDSGIHVGSTEAEFQAAYPQARANDPSTADPDGTLIYSFPFNDGTLAGKYRVNRSISPWVTVLDGVVTGIGSARQFC